MPEAQSISHAGPSPLKVVLIIPARDEEASIGDMLRSIPAGMFETVIVADNGSRDATAAVARANGASVTSCPEGGYGAACLRAMQDIPAGADVVVFMQADCSEDPGEAPKILAPIFEGRADLVIGSRTLGRADPGSLTPHQRFGNWLATALVRMVYRHRYTDLGPFRAIRWDSLQRLRMRDQNYGWTVEMQIRALRRGLRVVEVPVSYHRRLAGVNKVSGSLKASLNAGRVIIWTVFKLAMEKD